jgi:putative membrane protein
MMKRILIVASCVSALAAPAFAQYPKSYPKSTPPSGSPSSGSPAGSPASEPTRAKAGAAATEGSLHRMTADRAMMTALAQSGYDGVMMAKLGTEKASNADVKRFAQEMADSSRKLNEDVKPMMKAQGVDAPTALAARRQGSYDALTKMSGPDFDRAFVTEMASSCSNDVMMLQRASMMARDEDVKAWATKTLPDAQAHEQAARDLMQKLIAAK